MLDLITQNSVLVVKKSKTSTAASFQTKKAFKEANPDLGCAALKRAYNNMIRDNGEEMREQFIDHLRDTKAFPKSVRGFKNGNFSGSFVHPKNLRVKGQEIPVEAMDKTVEASSDEDLILLRDKINARLAK